VGKIHCTAIQANSTAIKLTYRKLPVTQITKVYMHVLRDIAISKLIRFWMKCSYKKSNHVGVNVQKWKSVNVESHFVDNAT